MKPADAMSFLGLSGEITEEKLKAAFRAAAKKYHPDVNPAGENMMKAVNAAFDVLKSMIGQSIEADQTTAGEGYPEALNEALNAVQGLLGLEIEICGNWAWVGGNTREHREALKAAHFRWAPKKHRWYFRPDEWKSRARGNLSMEEIRERHGSQAFRAGSRAQITGAA